MADKGKLTGLEMLMDEKKVQDLLTQKTGVKAVMRAGCNLALFICFLLLFTGLALSEPLGDHRAFEGYIRRRFDTAGAMPLREVETVSSFWQYINVTFMPAVYGNDTAKYYYPTHKVAKLLQIEGGNRLLGVARLRMLKIVPGEGCSVKSSLAESFPTCYGPFAQDAGDTVPFGPPNDQTGDPVFQYTSDPAGSWAEGKVASYPPGGYMEAFTANHNDTMKAVRMMIDQDFLGAGTRVVVIDWTVYNFNLGCYGVCRLLFEVTPSGLWEKSFDVDVIMRRHLSPLGGKTTGDWLALLGEVILAPFVLRYIMEEASEFVGFKGRRPYIKWDYFADAWNVLDWVNLVLMIVTLVIRIGTWGLAGNLQVYIGDPAKAGVSTFTDLNGVAMNIRLVHRLIAFNTVLTWFKAVKYISILPYITTFMETVSKSQTALSTFIVIFFTLFWGFILAYTVAFGETLAVFRTPWSTFIFLSRSFLGNADFGIVIKIAPTVGGFLVFVFVIAIFFVCVNLFYAIMIRALADLREEEDMKAGPKEWEKVQDKAKDFWNAISASFRLEHRFRTCFPGLYSRMKLRGKQQEEKEKERDDEVLRRFRARKPDVSKALGPGDPGLGRRPKRASNSISADDMDDSDNESEIDLGPLRNRLQLTKGGEFALADDTDAAHDADDDSSCMPLAGDDDGGEPPPEAIKLVVDATRHVVDGLVDRTYQARGVLLGEMAESKEVLLKVGSVLQVLGKRARDLEAQQRDLLKNF